jgi:hypothetical protein
MVPVVIATAAAVVPAVVPAVIPATVLPRVLGRAVTVSATGTSAAAAAVLPAVSLESGIVPPGHFLPLLASSHDLGVIITPRILNESGKKVDLFGLSLMSNIL